MKTRLLRAIAILEEKRGELGNEIIDAAQAPLLEKLDKLDNTRSGSKKKLRKYVTVLFADISDFTVICRSNDAEYVTEALNYLWTSLDSIIIRHGGIIDKHIGDAVMALWGTETVQENDAERAIKAALEMQASSEKILPDKEIGIPKFRMRIGIHSGPVFLSTIGLKGEFTAMGDTVNIASRLQSSAPLGRVIVSHDAYRHARNAVTFEPREPIEVKGIADPLKTYIALSANQGKFQEINTGILGIETEMIGRGEELRKLISTFDTVMLEATPRMVTIIGDAGIGKSRLLHEFRKKVEQESTDTIFFNARCIPEMKNSPCSIFRDILRYRMNVRENDSTETACKKFEAEMCRYLSRDEVHIACHYAGFDFSLSEPVKKLMGTPALAATGQSCLINYFKGTVADYRTLIYLEDLHWADNTSLDLIERMARDITSGKLLILALSRPPLLETRSSWGEGLPHQFIDLKPLSRKDSGNLVRNILNKVENLPPDITELVTSSSDGNPFYVEELIAMLVEDGAIIPGEDRWTVNPSAMLSISVPSTLTGVLQARLDSLPDDEKELLQKASVIGRLFWDLAVENLYKKTKEIKIDPMLSFVQSRNLVHENEDSTFDSAREYLFKHAILRDVTYDTVLLKLRKMYHRNVAEWLVGYSGDRVSEFSGIIAEHFERGRDRENAVVWLSRSGRSAFSTSSYSEALSAFLRALNILPENYSDQAQLHLDTGDTLEKLARYDEACEHLDRALMIAEADMKPGIAAQSLLGLTWIAILRGQIERSQKLGTRAYELAGESGDKAILARATMRMADFDEERNYDNCLSYMKRSYELYRQIDNVNGIAITQLNMGNTAMSFDRTEDAGEYYRKSQKAYESLGNQWGIANCLGNLGNVSYTRGDYIESMELHERSLAISARIGDGEGEVICNLNLGRDEMKLGNPVESFEHYRCAFEKAAKLGLSPLAMAVLLEIVKKMIEEKLFDTAALALFFMQVHEDSHFLNKDKADVKNLIGDILDELTEEQKTEIRAKAESLSLPEIADIVLEVI